MDPIKLVQLLSELVEALRRHNIKPIDLLAAIAEVEPQIKASGIKLSPEIDLALGLLSIFRD